MTDRNFSTLRAAALAAPTLAFAGFELAQKLLLPAYLTNHVGIDVAIAGALLLAVRLLHILTDWIAGVLSDAPLAARWGRRRTWMSIGMAPALAGTFAAFAAPPGAAPWMLALSLAAMTLGWSIINSAHGAWAFEAGVGIQTRSRVFAVRTAAGVIGYFAFSGLVWSAGREIGAQLWLVTLALLAATPLTALAAFRLVPERPHRAGSAPARISLRFALLAPFASARSARIAALFALVGANQAVSMGSFIYTMGNGLQLPDLAGPAIFAQAAATCLGLPLGLLALRRLGAENVLRGVLVAELAASTTLLFLPPGEAAPALVWAVLRGAFSGVDFMILRALAGEELDRDASESPRAGAYYAAFHMPFNLAGALATGALFWLYGLIGFDPKNPAQGVPGLLQIPAFSGMALTGLALALASVRKRPAAAIVEQT